MNIKFRWIGFAVVVVFLFALSGCVSTTSVFSGNGAVIGQSFILREGETWDQDLSIIGGSAVLEKGSVVNGDVALIGGTLLVDGTVTGDISAMGGVISLGSHAVVEGDIVTLGANLNRDTGSVVKGQFQNDFPSFSFPVQPVTPRFGIFDTLMNIFWRVFQAFALGALAVLVALFMLQPLERVGTTMQSTPVQSGVVGFLTFLVGLGVLLVMAITIIFLPLSLLGILALGLAWIYGWLATGLLTGEKIAELFHTSWSGPVSAGVGTLVLSLMANLLGAIPCVGWMIPFVVTMIGLGAVILSRFGTQKYPVPVPVVPSSSAME
ncbi:polymer-forming cytoskeletal protein [Anaerolinea thermophila]|uniref:Hypothetical membrane protein n=1 Tax=Anaerolinea thermophila (strain DSM 14523 / JCM 11388 / NBRC 100420 / UNI-1) TaxID=926569 RepID=E8N4I4_ANATU|nr:polymer-forming cytoskeletal protein [Anaerolinea thermophila]BAJ63348.1 hypothetical membrane protein [Anaerolinea thermophila UNI-1]